MGILRQTERCQHLLKNAIFTEFCHGLYAKGIDDALYHVRNHPVDNIPEGHGRSTLWDILFFGCKVTENKWYKDVFPRLFYGSRLIETTMEQMFLSVDKPPPLSLAQEMPCARLSFNGYWLIVWERLRRLYRTITIYSARKIEDPSSKTAFISITANRFVHVWQLSFVLVAVATQSCGSCHSILW